MALRITQGIMYNSMVSSMNRNLTDLMESNLQGSSGLKINRPSDDPVGAGRVISYNASLYNLTTYENNVKQAMGWLSTADSTLTGEGSVQDVLKRIKTLAEQAASETYDGSNREQISYELRQHFMQLINLSNTTFEGRHIFAGHKTDQAAYVQALGVSSYNEAVNSALSANNADPDRPVMTLTADGGSATTVIIQITETGGNGTAGATGTLGTDTRFRYSSDGGKTWHTDGTVTQEGDDFVLHATQSGVTMRANNAAYSTIQPPPAPQQPASPIPVTVVDPAKDKDSDNGTWLYVRPTAVYQGDDHDTQVTIPYGSTLGASANGYFTRDVAVRIDGDNGTNLTYSYSLDDGNTWTQVTAPSGSTDLPIPGGYLKLSPAPGAANAGEQFTIHPHRADINFDIGPSDSITVNMVGKDIFGGLYLNPRTGELEKADNVSGVNLFEAVGDLICALETNNPDQVAANLERLTAAMNVVLTKEATVGGRENRLTVTEAAIAMRKLDESENLSNVEDVDVTELMTRLAQQQVAYNSVLKSSSMIMQMSLVNFL